jgi:hypothetical protein
MHAPNFMSTFRTLGRLPVEVVGFRDLCGISKQAYFLRRVSCSPNLRLEDRPLSAIRDCFQYTRSYPPHVEVVSSVSDVRTRHAVLQQTQHQ